ncbi:MAG: DUF2726 domain-containing protein [Anaerolineales bacterium]|nr:DUF2726 domain-containing protein [Anaerolineales bacterium]
MLRKLAQFFKKIFQKLGLFKTPPASASPTPQLETPSASPLTPPSTPPLVAPELTIPSTEPPIYQMWESLFTYREKVFFNALLDALKWDYWAFAKVRMGDVLHISNEPGDRKFYNNQVNCKHLDFIVCEKRTFRPVLAIELDDSTHLHPDKQARDDFKNKVLMQAGLPLLRVKIQTVYSPVRLRDEIFDLLLKKTPVQSNKFGKEDA